jgi:formate--tetrahydrofolate ligase
MTVSDQHTKSDTDVEIAKAASLRPIRELVAERWDTPEDQLESYGQYKAKLRLNFIESLSDRPDGKLILVTAMTPTHAGEGKTTTTVGLGDALNRIGKDAIVCLREPSLGPCFGMKGGGTGGGYAQVVPTDDINLHFTGDLHAISAAHNLLASMIDNHVYWGNNADLDVRRISWRRVLDMNDRALRQITIGLGGPANGFPREAGFDITAASEVNAILCLSESLGELQTRLGNIIVGQTRDRHPVRARDIGAEGAMAVLLKDAIQPNVVQTLENNLAFVHGGPFANIAHGCNSVLATKAALKLGSYVVTEAGFGTDLGAEKFFNIKCRKAELQPHCAVLVATVRALKAHGGTTASDLATEDPEAVKNGAPNLVRHVENLKKFGVPVVIALNRFSTDTEAEIAIARDIGMDLGVDVVVADHWARGGEGAENLAKSVVRIVEEQPADFRLLYANGETLWNKVRFVAQSIYGADKIIADKAVRNRFQELQNTGFGEYPVCIAKTQYSFSTDPNLKGAPEHHVVSIRDVHVAAGAEFIVVHCGRIMSMPGLPRKPLALNMSID